MTHLAYVCEDTGIPVDGTKGASVHVRSMVGAFARLGVAVSLVSPRIGEEEWLRKLPIRPVRMDRKKAAANVACEEKDKAWKRMFRLLDELDDHHPIDAVYERMSLWACGSSLWCRKRGKDHWVEVNAPLVNEASRYREIDDLPGAAHVESEILRHATTLLPVSGWLERWLRGLGCAPDVIHRLPNGVDEHWLTNGNGVDPPRDGSPLTVGFVGSLRPWHDLDTLLQAFELLPAERFRLMIVGDGPLGEWLGEAISKPPLRGRVEWTGALPRNEVCRAIDKMNIGLAPYRGDEDFYFCPIKIFEYGARCRPVVTAEIPDLVEQFPDDTLILYRPSDAASLADALMSLAGDHERRRSFATRLRDYVKQHTWSAHAAQVLAWGGYQRVDELVEAAI